MSKRRSVCVLCKQDIDGSDSGLTEVNGGPAYKQLCRSCGWFVAEAPAITILDGAVKDEVRTREDILEHFRRRIAVDNKDSNAAIITTDDAQAYCYPREFTVADLVYARLMNGPLRVMQEDISGLKTDVSGLTSDVSYLKEEMSSLHRKFDDQHEWFTTLSQRVDDLEANQ